MSRGLVERLRIGTPRDNPDYEVVWVQNMRAHFKDGMFTRKVSPEWSEILLNNINNLISAASEAADALEAQEARIEGAVSLLERLRHWIEEEVGAELPFTQEEEDLFYTFISKPQEHHNETDN